MDDFGRFVVSKLNIVRQEKNSTKAGEKNLWSCRCSVARACQYDYSINLLVGCRSAVLAGWSCSLLFYILYFITV